MKYCRVTIQVDGNIISEPRVPPCCIPILKWFTTIAGAVISIGTIQDTRDK